MPVIRNAPNAWNQKCLKILTSWNASKCQHPKNECAIKCLKCLLKTWTHKCLKKSFSKMLFCHSLGNRSVLVGRNRGWEGGRVGDRKEFDRKFEKEFEKFDREFEKIETGGFFWFGRRESVCRSQRSERRIKKNLFKNLSSIQIFFLIQKYFFYIFVFQKCIKLKGLASLFPGNVINIKTNTIHIHWTQNN